jgi:histidinol phosphatase-like enzyme
VSIEERQGYIVINQKQGYSQKTGRPMTTIEFLGVGDRQIWTTYIVANHKNKQNWSYICDKPAQGMVVTFHKFRSVDPTKRIIDGDSVPRIELEADRDQLIIECQAVWDIEDQKRTVFGRLFGMNNE